MILTNIFGWVSKYIKLVAAFIIMILVAIVCFLRNQLTRKNIELDKVKNNIEFYQELLSKEEINNRTLLMSIEEFKLSKDSLILSLNNIRNDLKIRDKELLQALLQNQEIKIDTTFIVDSQDFVKEIKPNNLTSLIITKKDSILTAKLDIYNEQVLFISTKKEYKNKYKNWFRRLIHFDFKKRYIYNYQIHNTNDIIKIKETRLVELLK